MERKENSANPVRKQRILAEIEKKVISLVQGDLPIVKRPFLELARQLGVEEDGKTYAVSTA